MQEEVDYQVRLSLNLDGLKLRESLPAFGMPMCYLYGLLESLQYVCNCTYCVAEVHMAVRTRAGYVGDDFRVPCFFVGHQRGDVGHPPTCVTSFVL